MSCQHTSTDTEGVNQCEDESVSGDSDSTEFSHSSALHDLYQRESLCCALLSMLGGLFAYILCLKQSQGCISRTAVGFLWLTVIALGCNVVTRYVAFSSTTHSMSPGDMKLIKSKMSTVFCSGSTLSAQLSTYSVLESTPYFMANLMPWNPPIKHGVYKNQSLLHQRIALSPYAFKYWKFNLLQESRSQVSFRINRGEVVFRVIRGERNFQKYLNNHNCIECNLYRVQRDWSHPDVTFSFEALYSDDYFFVFEDFHPSNKSTGSQIVVNFNLRRTQYDRSYVKSTCTTRYLGSCSFSLLFGSTEVMLVMMPDNNIESILINSSCEPRTAVYMIFFVLMPLSVIMLAAVSIYTFTKVCPCTASCRQGEENSPEYDIIPSFENHTVPVMENTPLLHSLLPSYDQAVSDRATDVVSHQAPPPNYHTAINS